jgi:hypothetical protein
MIAVNSAFGAGMSRAVDAQHGGAPGQFAMGEPHGTLLRNPHSVDLEDTQEGAGQSHPHGACEVGKK